MIYRITGVQRRLIDGKAASFEEYKEWAGRIKGVLEVFEAPDQLQESVRKEMEAFEERERLAQ